MHRTQILLDDEQYEMMRTLAEKEGRSLSSLVREAVRRFLQARARRSPTKLAEITGVGDDPDSRGRDHDDLLYGPRRRG